MCGASQLPGRGPTDVDVAPVNQKSDDDDDINTIYQFINPFLENKMSIFEKYRAFKKSVNAEMFKL